MLNLPAYLDRIGYSGLTDCSEETLRALHRAHMFAVPFENLDIHIGRVIVCDEDRFLHKIVDERRGGFCYELNGAFAALLRALGFQVTLLSARVTRADGADGREFDHLALRVDLPSVRPEGLPAKVPWLADVGFGDSFIEPLRLLPNIEQPQAGQVYRLIERSTEGGTFNMEMKKDGQWKPQYSFSLRPRTLFDFSAMCHYHQTSPDSHFTQQRICSRATPQGRISLSDFKLIETRDGVKNERELAGEQQWREALREFFRVDLPS